VTNIVIITVPTAVGNAVYRGPRRVRCWSLWSLPHAAVGVIVSVDLVAAGLTGLAWLPGRLPSAGEWGRWLLLVALAIGYTEATERLELLYRHLSADNSHVAMIGVWALPAALVLPPALAVLLNVAVTARLMAWTVRTAANHTHRELFSGATGVLATLAGSTISAATGLRAAFWSFSWPVWAPLALLAAMVAYTVVNAGLVLAGIYSATRPTGLRTLLLSREDLTLEYASLLLGVLVAVTVTRTPWLTPFVTAILVLLQRSALVAKLRDAASQDGKTGLLNAVTWEQRATAELHRAERENAPAAVLLIDLDHFKRINDTHGHLAGDAALRAVAAALTTELRGHDVIGRYGGEEFAVLIPGAGTRAASAVAERVRSRIARAGHDLDLTASIGIAHYPGHGNTVARLLGAADTALYAAKDAGRNRVSAAA
jgi:diguanylate cyclase (GGDEF)-like protein